MQPPYSISNVWLAAKTPQDRNDLKIADTQEAGRQGQQTCGDQRSPGDEQVAPKTALRSDDAPGKEERSPAKLANGTNPQSASLRMSPNPGRLHLGKAR